MVKLRRTNWAQQLANGATPIVVMDAEARVLAVNKAFETLTGWHQSDLAGKVCARISPAQMTAEQTLLTSLSPPADVLNGRIRLCPVMLPDKSSGVLQVTLNFIPLQNSDQTLAGILLAVDPQSDDIVTTSQSVIRQLHAEVTALRFEMRQRHGTDSLVGRCAALQRAIRQSALLMRSPAGFTVVGETGTGRTHFCRTVFYGAEKDSTAPAIVDCRLLTAERLLAVLSELRRIHQSDRRGSLPQAAMIVLAEIQELPREVQAWMMRDGAAFVADIRMCATSTRLPELLVREGQLLPEFSELLSDVIVELPSLHIRGDDIGLLTQHFAGQMKRLHATQPTSVSAEVLGAFAEYRWPGNVAELRSVTEQACRRCQTDIIDIADLPLQFRSGQQAQQLGPQPSVVQDVDLESLLLRFERETIQRTLAACSGNRAETARRLGMTRPRLYRRLEQLGLATSEEPS